MKKIFIVTLILLFNYTSNLVAEINCDNAINKLKPDCIISLNGWNATHFVEFQQTFKIFETNRVSRSGQ